MCSLFYKKRSRPIINNINIIININYNSNAINSENEDSKNIVKTSKDNTVILKKRLTLIETAKMHMTLHLIKICGKSLINSLIQKVLLISIKL